MRILVTGVTGLIGGAVARRLGESGHSVIGVSRSGAAPSCDGSIAADLAAEDFADRAGVAACGAIVHAGARMDRKLDRTTVSAVNCAGTHRIVDLAFRWGGARIVYISSIGVVGEPRFRPIDEQHPVFPLSVYHASKWYGEQLMAAAHREGIPAVSLRVTAPVGPGMPVDRILPEFVRRASSGAPLKVAGRGDRLQDYVHVEDVASAVLRALERPSVNGVINIGSGRSVTNAELARMCTALLRSVSPIQFCGEDPEGGRAWEVSIARAREMLGYAPVHTLEETILSLGDWHASRDSQ